MIDCRKYRILKRRIAGRMRAFGVLFACVLPMLFSVACNTEACLESKTSIFNAAFYAYGDSAAKVVVDSVSVYGVGQFNDSLLVDTANISSFQATLRSDRDTTQYVIRYDQHNLNPRYKRDTLTFVYHTYIEFESAECGAMYNYVIDDFRYTTWQIVDAELMTSEVNNQDVENVRLYYYVVK